MTVHIRYCGGCNPRYDRQALAERIRRRFPQITFASDPGAGDGAVVIFCGCPSACVDVTESYGTYGRFVIWSEAAQKRLEEFLDNICQREKGDLPDGAGTLPTGGEKA